MIRRLIVGMSAWVAAMILFAMGLQQSSRPRQDQPSWTVTRKISYQRVMVVDVNARRGVDPATIAATILQPAQSKRYEEVLIYVHQPTDGGPAAVRRVQWTPGSGFRTLVIRDE